MTPIPITPELVQAACHAAEPGLYDGSIANAMTPTLLLKPYTSATEVYVAARQRILTRQMTAALKAVARLTLSEPLPVVAHKGPHDSDAELFSNAAENIKGGRYPRRPERPRRHSPADLPRNPARPAPRRRR